MMKILVAHNHYQQHGGEDSVVANEVAMLRRFGHDVQCLVADNREVVGIAGRLRAAAGVVFSLDGYIRTKKALVTFRPDVVHVHNFFPLLSPSIFYACARHRTPVVFTLHNFRILCPTAFLFHHGAVTERSLVRGPWWAVRERVYRQSLLGTFLLVTMIVVHRRMGTWNNVVTRYIALTNFARDIFVRAGLPQERIDIKPNFVRASDAAPHPRSRFLYVGRLSKEKGIRTLAAALAIANLPTIVCRVVGGGGRKSQSSVACMELSVWAFSGPKR